MVQSPMDSILKTENWRRKLTSGDPRKSLTVLRMAPFVYTPEGEKIAQTLWQETMNELAFARVADILQELST